MEPSQEITTSSNTNYINLADLSTKKPSINYTNTTIDPNEIYHCLCPRDWRTMLSLSIPDTVDEKNMINTIIPQTINETNPTYLNIILNIDCVHARTEGVRTYNITMLSIHNKIIDGIRSNNIKQCIFYVGFLKNKREFKIFNKQPNDKDLAKVNYSGNSISYKSKIIIFN